MSAGGEPSETRPLLASTSADLEHNLVYQRFSERKKWVIVTLASWCGIIPLFISGTFIPSIPQIAKDLNTTGSVVSLAVSISMFAASCGTLTAAAYSTFYGRRIIYLVMLPLFCIGSFGVSQSKNVPELMSWRFVQALGASPGLSVGAGMIGDIFALEKRGTAMGIFLAASLFGVAIAPPIGGFFTQYYTWRILQIVMALTGCAIFLFISTFLPETSHPGSRGIDKIPNGQSKIVFVNPLKPLELLLSPNLFLVIMSTSLILLTDYVALVPLAYTIGARYGITSAAILGACFLPSGIGNMIGAPLAGKLSDRAVAEWRKRRGGTWYPEDRLRAANFGSLVLVPVPLFCSGLLIQYVPGTVGLMLNLVCLFVHGIGVDFFLSPCGAYSVDIMHSRSAEAMAAGMGMRALLVSICVSGIIPAIESFGALAVNSFAAIASLLGWLIISFVIRYGEDLRSWVDIGYSTAQDN